MTCSNPLPGYDAWKLASPYDDDGRECEVCGDEASCGDLIVGFYCHRCQAGPDPDEAYERLRAERDARPGDVDYLPPFDPEDF